MTIKEFMQKTGVSKKVYVENWIREGLIPGVLKDEKTGELIFPSSARRPYKPRFKSDANASTVRASILNACLKREYISSKIYSMSEVKFKVITPSGVLYESLINKLTEISRKFYPTLTF